MGSFRSVGVNGLRSLKGFASLTIDTALASADLLVIEGQQAFNFQRSKIGAKHQANIRDKVSTVDSIVQLFLEKIMNVKLAEWNLCGYISGRQRVMVPISKVNGLLRRGLNIAKFFGDTAYRLSSRILNHPSEMNLVACNDKCNSW